MQARTEELYRRHARLVGGLCRALLRDRAEAEDASQQVFLSAHRALLNGSAPREPAAWLATIARNECWARIHAGMRRPTVAARYEGSCEGSLEGSHAPDSLVEVIRRADMHELWVAVSELPSQQRDALLLREFGGLSYEALSAALSVSTPAVESLLVRARQRLRRRLEGVYAGLGGAGWGDALVRLLGGGGGAAPVAAKAAALGLGVAAVTGGAALVVPGVELHAPPALVHHVSHGATHSHRAPPAVAASTPLRVAPHPAVLTVAAPVRRHRSGESERRAAGPAASSRGGGRDGRSGRDGGSGRDGSGEGRDGSGEDTQAVAAFAPAQPTGQAEPTVTVVSSKSEDGDGSGSGDGGSSGSDGGGSDGGGSDSGSDG